MKGIRVYFSECEILKDIENINKYTLYKKVSSKMNYQTYSNGYFKEYFGDDFEDASIFVLNDEKLVVYIPATVSEKEISCFKRPVEIFEDFDNEGQRQVVYKFFLKKFKKRLMDCNLSIVLSEHSRILKSFYENIKNIETLFLGEIDLGLSSDEILKGVRKSYRSLINWGKDNLETNIYNKENITEEKFLEFKKLHFEAAGIMTRSDESWNLQLKQILNNEAFLIISYMDKIAVSSVFIMIDDVAAFYAVGASNRKLIGEGTPLAHFPLIESIFYCKELGLKRYKFGNLSFNSKDSKVNNICKFKRGFCSDIKTETFFRLSDF